MEILNLFDFFSVSKETQKMLIYDYDTRKFAIANFYNVENDNVMLFLGKDLENEISINKLFSIKIPSNEENPILSTLINSLVDSKLSENQWILFNTDLELHDEYLNFHYCNPEDLKKCPTEETIKLAEFLETIVSKNFILENIGEAVNG